jgi:DNA-binding CsgD family transcriptional regulator
MLLDDYERISEAGSREEFQAAIVEFAEARGFPLVSSSLVTDGPRGSHFETVSNVPKEFVASFNSAPDFRRDPVMQAIKVKNRPVVWNQATYREAGAIDVWETQAAFGYKNGIAVAMHLPQGKHFLLGIDRSEPLPRNALKLTRIVADLQLLAVHAQDAALRLLQSPPSAAPRLTIRELEVLEWVLKGKSNPVIGQLLSMSENTVEFHLKNIFRRLDCSNRHSAVLKAVSFGLVSATGGA